MIKLGNGQIALGDCLDVMRSIPSGSVDMILCDLPYGTTDLSWDKAIGFEPLWLHYRRVVKENAAIVLTASQPFSSALVISNLKEFKYEWIWHKNMAGNVFNAKIQPMKYHESILVFYKTQPVYNPEMVPRFSEAAKRTASKPISSGKGKKNGHSSDYIKPILKQYDPEMKSPESVLQFKCVPNGGGHKLHPTQKPVALFEYLIKTYTNEGDTVLDNCLGSGTTAIAAENTGRRWIGIERDPTYYGLACERIARHVYP